MRPIHLIRSVCVGLALAAAPVRADTDDVTVFAAASLSDALDRIAAVWTEKTGVPVAVSYAGSSALAAQIKQGAPADIFISASVDWMDDVAANGDLRDNTRRQILSNTLVLIAHGSDVPPVEIDENLDLAGMLGDERLAMALVDAVPAGIYGKAALVSLGLWDDVAPQIAQADNVRAALTFVARDEAPFGIVYATDAAAADDVTVIGTFPADSHDPIVYPAAVTAQSEHEQAKDFLDFLTSEPAQIIWTEFGFGLRK